MLSFMIAITKNVTFRWELSRAFNFSFAQLSLYFVRLAV